MSLQRDGRLVRDQPGLLGVNGGQDRTVWQFLPGPDDPLGLTARRNHCAFSRQRRNAQVTVSPGHLTHSARLLRFAGSRCLRGRIATRLDRSNIDTLGG